jgi:Domain of unknown function (DUF4337)
MTTENTSTETASTEQKTRRLDLIAGVVLSLFAACMAINDLGAGKYGDDEMIAHNKQGAMYSWYQSKSLKQSIVEGQRDLILALVASNTIEQKKVSAMDTFSNTLTLEANRYEKEKNEILNGSKTIGEKNWIQKVDGELGKVKGAEEWDKEAATLGEAGDVFDRATLFLQICLVFGAISIVLQNYSGKKIFLTFMIVCGIIGTVISSIAYSIAFSI